MGQARSEESVILGARQCIHEGTLQKRGDQWVLVGCTRWNEEQKGYDQYDVSVTDLLSGMAGEEVRFILISLKDVATIQKLVEQEQQEQAGR